MTTELGVRLSPCVLSADSIRAVELPPWMCSTPIGSGRRPSLRQAWLMDPSLRIVVVETATGQLSWPLPNEASSSCSAKWTRSLTEQRPQISRNPGVGPPYALILMLLGSGICPTRLRIVDHDGQMTPDRLRRCH